MFEMTKEEALKIQAEDVAWYSKDRADVAQIVASVTTADDLEAGIRYPVTIINRHIPRGLDIEYLINKNVGGE